MKKRIIVSGIICKGEEVLLGKKAKGRPPYPDVWHTMGGGVNNPKKATQLLNKADYNNSYLVDELRRELREEANIEIINPTNICPKYRSKPREAVSKNKHGEDTHYIFLEYLCDLDPNSGSGKPSDDITEIQWVAKKDLKIVPLTPPSQKMYRELGWITKES
jgi:8-oxo-dGTP pyrophosphatase MutT (NUDIX family)